MTINTVKHGKLDPNALVDIKLTPSAGSDIRIIVYPPGCSTKLTPAAPCYGAFGTEVKMLNPVNGTYTIQAACYICAGATYTATATLSDFFYTLPAAGNTKYGFVTTQLSSTDQNGNPTSYGEPGIWINSSGNEIVNTFGPTVWVSHDSGVSWSGAYDLLPQDTLCPQAYSGDADAVIGNDNTYYADNLCVGTGVGSNNDSFTNRNGGANNSWTGPNAAGTNVDRQWYAPDPSNPGVAYISYHDLQGPNINVLKSTDYGTTWICPATGLQEASCPVTATPVSNVINSNYVYTSLGNVTGRPVIDPTNPQQIYLPYADNSSTNGVTASTPDFDLNRLRLAVSTDGGHTWSADANPAGTPVLDANKAFPYDGTDDNTVAHNFPFLAIDTAGNLYYMVSVRLGNSNETHLYLITSTNHGVSWSAPIQIDQGINSNLMPWIAAGSPGHVVVSWYGSLAIDFNDTSAAWSEMFSSSANALSSAPTFTQANISGTITPVHVGDICELGLNCVITGGNRDLSDFQMIAVDPCGFAQPVWTDDHSGSGFTEAARQTGGMTAYTTTCKK